MAEKRKPQRGGLGRGLSALMAETQAETPRGPAQTKPHAEQFVPIDRIHPNPDQPRKTFSEEALVELTNSVAEKGVIQPLIVRNAPNGEGYEIVAGERRWRAAQRAQLHELPVIVRTFTDTEVLEIAIIENIQRSDLNPIEEGRAYRQLMERHGHTQDQLSDALGKSRSHIANTMRLLNLPAEVLTLVEQGKLTSGHARALLTAEDPSALARRVVAAGLSVREVEKLVKSGNKPEKPTRPDKVTKDADTRAIEDELSATLGLKVEINHTESGRGQLTLTYPTTAHLDDLCRLLTRAGD